MAIDRSRARGRSVSGECADIVAAVSRLDVAIARSIAVPHTRSGGSVRRYTVDTRAPAFAAHSVGVVRSRLLELLAALVPDCAMGDWLVVGVRDNTHRRARRLTVSRSDSMAGVTRVVCQRVHASDLDSDSDGYAGPQPLARELFPATLGTRRQK
jgi:hypothetical protein